MNRGLILGKKPGGWALIFCALLAGLLFIAGSAGAARDRSVPQSLEELNSPDRIIGISTGSVTEEYLQKEAPNASLGYYNDKFMGYTDVANGKIDAFVYDYRQMELAIQNGQKGVRLLDECLAETMKIAIGISAVSDIPDLKGKINRFIADCKADGTLDDLFQRWVTDGNETMPDIPIPEAPEYQLKVGTCGIAPPYSYYEGSKLTGYDIELARRFAAWLNAKLTFQVYDYTAIIPALKAGKVDCVMANLQYSKEREENFVYSDILYEEKQGIMVRDDGSGENGAGSISSLDRLNGKRIGIQTGTTFDKIVLEALPDAQIHYFNNYTDMAAALETHKIDAFPGEEPVMRLMLAENDRLAMLDDRLDSFELGIALAKTESGNRLRDEMNTWLAKMKESGELEKLIEKWTDGPESEKTIPDYTSFPAEKGTLQMATEAAYAPMDYYRGGEIVGLEVDLAARFCKDNGYRMVLQALNFDGVLPAVQSGKADFAMASIAITEEREESVTFTDSYYSSGTVMIVLREEVAGAAGAGGTGDQKTDFWGNVVSSFEKTFLREDRWQLFLQGVVNTLIITLASILCGTLLGFAVFMLCRKGNPICNGITRFSIWLVQGMPMVVLLMILYYIIFGKSNIGGIAVAIIGFTLTFGAAVIGLLRMGVGAVDPGQYEAAYALGYSNRRTFFKIILPQALPHVMSAYKGEIVGLIKSTSIVGYIAVQDLTKMGDIIRSRTYEAFFPLIAVTIIYFTLEGIIGALISRISININPKHRKAEKILKGVKTDDQD